MDADRSKDLEHSHSPSSGTETIEVQDGVRKAKAIASTWTPLWLWIAYGGMLAMAFSTSMGEQVNSQLGAFATSSFGKHSMMSTVHVISGVLNAVFQPPMAKFSDVFGRTEGFVLALYFYVLGHAMASGASSIRMYAAAQIFQAAGITGLKIMQQVFVADSSDILNRMIMGSLPDIPFIITVWVAPIITQKLETRWRWGIGMWAIATAAVSPVLILTLYYHQRKANKLSPQQPGTPRYTGIWNYVTGFTQDVDLVGTLLLTAGFSCLLIPLTLSQSSPGKWGNEGIITSMVIGGLCLIFFPIWESSTRYAPTPLITRRLLKNRTVLSSCILAFFYFMAFFLSVQPYFYSYLIVSRDISTQHAGYILNIFSVSCTITVVTVGFLTKWLKRYKLFLWIGIILYTIGIGLMLRYRKVDAPLGAIIFTQILIGVGGGFTNGPAQVGLQASTSHQEVATATALFLTTLSLGGAVGSAVSGAIWSHHLHAKLGAYLPEDTVGRLEEIFGDMTIARSFPVGSMASDAIRRAYDETMHTLLICAVCVCIPMFVCMFFMENHDLGKIAEQQDDGRTVIGRSKKSKTME